jgi:hypothetical protein
VADVASRVAPRIFWGAIQTCPINVTIDCARAALQIRGTGRAAPVLHFVQPCKVPVSQRVYAASVGLNQPTTNTQRWCPGASPSQPGHLFYWNGNQTAFMGGHHTIPNA